MAGATGDLWTDSPMLPCEATREGHTLLAACPPIPAYFRDPLNARAEPTRHDRGGMPRARLYVAASPADDYFADCVATGPIRAIESGVFAAAPVGALLLTDSDDGERGVLCAERGADGWVIR